MVRLRNPSHKIMVPDQEPMNPVMASKYLGMSYPINETKLLMKIGMKDGIQVTTTSKCKACS